MRPRKAKKFADLPKADGGSGNVNEIIWAWTLAMNEACKFVVSDGQGIDKDEAEMQNAHVQRPSGFLMLQQSLCIHPPFVESSPTTPEDVRKDHQNPFVTVDRSGGRNATTNSVSK